MGLVGSSHKTRRPPLAVNALDDNDAFSKVSTPNNSRPRTLGTWKRRHNRRVSFPKRRCIKMSTKTQSKVPLKRKGMKRTRFKNRTAKRSAAGQTSNKRKSNVKKGPKKGGTRQKNQVKFAPGTKTNKIKSNKIPPSPPPESEETQQPPSYQDSKENASSWCIFTSLGSSCLGMLHPWICSIGLGHPCAIHPCHEWIASTHMHLRDSPPSQANCANAHAHLPFTLSKMYNKLHESFQVQRYIESYKMVKLSLHNKGCWQWVMDAI